MRAHARNFTLTHTSECAHSQMHTKQYEISRVDKVSRVEDLTKEA